MKSIGLILLGLVIFSGEAFGVPQCGERGIALEHLKNKYKEVVVGRGVTSAGGLVELLTSENGETWTIIVSTGKGVSCMVAAGEGWREIERVSVEARL